MYDKIYPEWCFSAHASDALDNLKFDPESNEVQLMFAGDVSKLPLAALVVFGCPNTTQDSLPVAGQALLDGVLTRKVSKL
jgi:hypothetical protein